MNNKKLGGLYGALLGDACGCPYEFKSAGKIPPFPQIDMIPPLGYNRSWKEILVGTYTDDGAQTLILAELLLTGMPLNTSSLRAKLYAWFGGGYMSVDNVTFDSGAQTKKAIMDCDSVEDVIDKLSDEQYSGNGSLMRSIPAALTAIDIEHAMLTGAKQSLVTHPNARCQMTCALYCGIAFQMLDGYEADDVLNDVFAKAHVLFAHHRREIDFIAAANFNNVTGTGYVVDSFWSALHALRVGSTFKDVIKAAIALGNDTDTIACIAGGLAGIKFGYTGLPKDWLDLLRGKYLIEPIANKLI